LSLLAAGALFAQTPTSPGEPAAQPSDPSAASQPRINAPLPNHRQERQPRRLAQKPRMLRRPHQKQAYEEKT